VCIRYDVENQELIAWSYLIRAWIPEGDWLQGLDTFPGYVAPILTPDWSDKGRPRKIQPAQWGLMPEWANEKMPKPLHARNDNLARSAMFRNALRNGRCVVPISGFYEQKDGRWVRFSGDKMLTVAAVSEPPSLRCQLSTYSLVTAEPNDVVGPYQDRMVVILHPEDIETWLAPETPIDRLLELCAPCPNDWLSAQDTGPNSRKAKPPKKAKERENLQGTLF